MTVNVSAFGGHQRVEKAYFSDCREALRYEETAPRLALMAAARAVDEVDEGLSTVWCPPLADIFFERYSIYREEQNSPK